MFRKKAYKYILSSLFILFFLISNSFAYPKDLIKDKNIVYKKLDNGFSYFLLKNKKPENRVSMHLAVNVGSAYETEKQQGIAHFLEHMLFNGTKNFPPNKLVEYFQSIGMELGPDTNASTGFFQTVYDIYLPKNSEEYLKNALNVFYDYSNYALLLQEEVEKERGVVLSEKMARDSIDYRIFVESLKFRLQGSNLPERFPIGKEKYIKSFNSNMFKDFYDTYYRPDNMFFVAVGDFDTKLLSSLIDEKFSNFKKRGKKENKALHINEVEHQGTKIFYHFEKESKNTSISIETIEKIKQEKDSLENLRNRIINYIISRIIQNRLDSELSGENPPFHSAGIYLNKFLKEFFISSVYAQCSPENYEKTLTFLNKFIRQALKYGFYEEEFTRAKKEILKEFEQLEKVEQETSNLSQKLIYEISNLRFINSYSQQKKIYLDIIKDLKKKELENCFKKIWDKNHRLVLVYGNKEIKKNPKKEILKVYNRADKKEAKKPSNISKIKFPYLKAPSKLGKVSQEKYITKVDIHTIDFKNGIRVNFKKSSFKQNEVLCALSFGKGKAGEPLSKPGLSKLAYYLIVESGLSKLKKK